MLIKLFLALTLLFASSQHQLNAGRRSVEYLSAQSSSQEHKHVYTKTNEREITYSSPILKDLKGKCWKCTLCEAITTDKSEVTPNHVAN